MTRIRARPIDRGGLDRAKGVRCVRLKKRIPDLPNGGLGMPQAGGKVLDYALPSLNAAPGYEAAAPPYCLPGRREEETEPRLRDGALFGFPAAS
jgi:hypothetical protein